MKSDKKNTEFYDFVVCLQAFLSAISSPGIYFDTTWFIVFVNPFFFSRRVNKI